MVSLRKAQHYSTISLGTVALGLVTQSVGAQANPLCAELPPPIIYGVGGSAQRPVLGKFAAKLRGAITVVYAAPGACNAIFYLRDGTKLKGTANYWEPDGTQKSCDLPVLGVDVNYGFMGNTELGCDGVSTLPANIGKYWGPVETANFIVPTAGSSESAITAEAAYFVFGFGGTLGKVDPWDSDSFVWGRDKNSFLTVTLAAALDIPLNKLNKAIDAKTNEATVSLVAGASNPSKAIGVVAGEIAAAYRGSVKTLAYQHFDQTCGYWPDSEANQLDKRSVRAGLYFLWSPISLFVAIDPATQTALDPNADKFVQYFTLKAPLPGEASTLGSLELQIRSSLTPQCAMNVWRDGDASPLYSFAPPEPCGCYFEKTATGDAPPSCRSCADDSACSSATPKCRFGYCEAY